MKKRFSQQIITHSWWCSWLANTLYTGDGCGFMSYQLILFFKCHKICRCRYSNQLTILIQVC